MSLIPNNPYGAAGFSLPQLYSLVFNVLKDLNILLQQNPQFGAGFNSGFNMGPRMDMFSPGNNIFTGSLGNHGCNALGNDPSCGMQGSSYRPNHTPLYEGAGDPATRDGMAPACGGTPSPTASTSASTGGTTSPSSGSGGSNPSYANTMLDTLRKMNAPESLIEAYRVQYQVLGLMPGGSGSAPGGGGPGAPGGGAPTDPSGGGAPTDPSGGAPTAGGDSPSTPAGGAPSTTADGSPIPTAGNAPPPTAGSAPTPTAGGSPSPTAGGSPTPSTVNGGTPGNLGPGFPKELEPVRQHILAASKASGVDANLITAVIMDEAQGNFEAGINGTLQYGLMQVDPNTYKLELQPKYHLSGDNINDPQTNIMAGAFHLKENIAQFGSIPVALRAYNSGPNGVDRNNLSALPSHTGTADYVDKVMKNYNMVAAGG